MIYGYFTKNDLLDVRRTKTHIYRNLSDLIYGPICGASIVQSSLRQFKKLGDVSDPYLNIIHSSMCGNCKIILSKL